jgi:hypothetical protein
MNTISYSRGARITDVHPRVEVAATFDAFRLALDRDRSESEKKRAGYFCAAMEGDGRRGEANAQPRRWLPFDIDGIAPAAVPRLFEFFSRWSAFAWETHSSSADEPRWRVIVELDRPVPRDECVELGRLLASRLHEHVGSSLKLDKTTFRPEQACYLAPAGRPFKCFGTAKLAVDDLLRHGATFRDTAASNAVLTEEGHKSSSVSLPFSSVSLLSAIQATTPHDGGERNDRLFEFARRLKALKPDVDREARRAASAAWHEAARPFIRTEDFAVTFDDFERGWSKVEKPHGVTMDAILQQAHDAPLPDGIEGLRYGPAANLLVRICATMHKHQVAEHSGDPLILPARQVGEWIGVDRTTANKMLHTLAADGVIGLVSKGGREIEQLPGGRRRLMSKASRYRYLWTTRSDAAQSAAVTRYATAATEVSA